MACKIVFVGGGSFLWTERFAIDLFLKPSLRGSELVLVDTDPESLDILTPYCQGLNERMSAGWKIGRADLLDALPGADYVMVSISTGGLEAFDRDYHIPEEFGVYHSVGDTVGPSGISRTLRNVPVFVDIARQMERLCPRAWMVHVTNPLAQLTRGVYRGADIRTVGLCHNYEGSMKFLSQLLGVERGTLAADTFGVNHFTFLDNPTCEGRPIQHQLTMERYFEFERQRGRPIDTQTTDDEINAMTGGDEPNDERLVFELLNLFGYWPVGGPAHVAENLPYFLNHPAVIRKHRIRRKGVLPNRLEGKNKRRRRIENILAGNEPFPEPRASHESLADIIASLDGAEPCRAVVNMPNIGQIPNLPRDVVVETWADIRGDSIVPAVTKPVPLVLKGLLESIIVEEELAVEAALTGSRKTLIQAMTLSPLLHDKDAAENLSDQLLAAQKEYLPQFNRNLHTDNKPREF